MFIRRISIDKYKVLEDVEINFSEKPNHNVFPIISINGGGKSTLLQVIFAFLHCAFKETRQDYLATLLQYFDGKNDGLDKLIEFEIEHEGQIIELEFFRCKNGYKKLNFDSILVLEDLHKQREEINEAVRKIEHLNKLKEDVKKSNISSSLVWNELKGFLKNGENDAHYGSHEASHQLEFIEGVKKKIENAFISEDELNAYLIKAEANKNHLIDRLEKDKMTYALHFDGNKDVLLYKSNVNDDVLSDISDRIYLAVPNTQILHFLEDDELSSLFTNKKHLYSSYEHYVKQCQERLTGLFTYDFAAIELILEAFRKARDDDFKKAIETGKYGSQIGQTREELNNLLSGKSITIDKDFKGVTFKSSGSQTKLTPKDLSHGELKKLSIYIWLKARTQDDSVILMDEVEVGLHPSWQHELYHDLQKWSKGNQYLLATHSPQIISNTYFKNLVVLNRTETGTSAEQFDEAPLESDLNTIVKTIMGSDYIPKELNELRKQYRILFEKGKTETSKAQKIKEQILEYESENSSFFQDLKFRMSFQV